MNPGDFLKDLLIDPRNGESLMFEPATNTLSGKKSGGKFSFLESVPRIINEEDQIRAKSGIHGKYDSSFNNGDHQGNAGYSRYWLW
jgi:hypothetical protein